MSSPFTCIRLLMLVACVLFGESAYATKIETLVMPGLLIEGHADIESECISCHSRFSPKAQSSLCLDCHKLVAADVNAKEGFHGRMDFSETDSCSLCHTDHKGRNADITGLNSEFFDHEKTDFPLIGRHKSQQCSSCHTDGKKWREAPSGCFSCHEKDDAHKGQLGKMCADCHSSSSWLKQSFDHNETNFALKGAHQEVQCNACHPNETYKNVPMDCVSCHRGDDVHRGGYEQKCDTCHGNVKWKEAKFNHNDTDFALTGVHQKTTCSSCHAVGEIASTIPTSCVSCHLVNDVHRGRNGDDCKSCHGTDDWSKPRFDHDRDTQFSLIGIHKVVTCNSCHAGGIKENAPVRECVECHKANDPHKGELGDACDDCHKPTGWHDSTHFDHELTGMPLYGMHALAECEGCHKSGQYAAVPTACIECHKSDDVHKGALEEQCGECHNANGWMFWNYNHDLTNFPLTGNHTDLACESCHKSSPPQNTPKDCFSCHKSDDVHLGRFGRNCERCHSTKAFDVNLIMTPNGDRE
ncbi:MAG: cytochrome C [Oleibacter sp.]|nr:cytochrome C [Thalassolituus sp.]